MKPIIIINTFNSVFIPDDKKTLIICDIDHTFLKPQFTFTQCYEQLKSNKLKFIDENELQQSAFEMYNKCITFGFVKQTDSEGFSQMLNKINLLNGKLIFLTARSCVFHNKTIKDLKRTRLQNVEEFKIHYTGNIITKGDYIKNNNLLNDYDHHIFIDDSPSFLESALAIYPDMNCYLFKHD